MGRGLDAGSGTGLNLALLRELGSCLKRKTRNGFVGTHLRSLPTCHGAELCTLTPRSMFNGQG